MRTFLLIFAVSLAVTVYGAAPVSSSSALVVLPFDNISGADQAPLEVVRLASKAIAARGWRVMDSDLGPLLEKERVRYLDGVDDGVRAKIVEQTGASGVVSGTVYTWSDGKNPIVAVAARFVRADGSLAWADVAALAADDTERLFGFGRRETADALAVRVVTELMRRFPTAGRESPSPRRSFSLFRSPAQSYRAPGLDPKGPHLVCVLPFANESRSPQAPRVFAEVLAIRLAAAEGFEVVEPARLREAVVKAHVASFRGIGTDDLARLGAAVGTSLFLRGTIYTYDDVTARGIDTPAIAVEMSLIDAQSGQVLWAAQHDRKGSDFTGLLLLGSVSNAVALADRAATELIEAQGAGVPRAAKAFAAARDARKTKRSIEARAEGRDPRQAEEKP